MRPVGAPPLPYPLPVARNCNGWRCKTPRWVITSRKPMMPQPRMCVASTEHDVMGHSADVSVLISGA